MPELLNPAAARNESREGGTGDLQRLVYRPSPTYCPVLRSFDQAHQPRRSSATYGVAVVLHLLLLAALCIRVHEAIHSIPADVVVNAVTLAAPAAPSAPVEPKVAAKVTEQMNKQRIQTERVPVLQTEMEPRIAQVSVPLTPPVLPSLFQMNSDEGIAPLSAPVSVAASKGTPNPGHEASEAAAPRSDAAPPGSPSGTKTTWEGTVLARLAQFRRYPASSRLRHEEGVVYIRFRMNREGAVLSSALERSSGFSALDKEALATILRAQPLPKIPPDRPDELEMSLPIEFFIQ